MGFQQYTNTTTRSMSKRGLNPMIFNIHLFWTKKITLRGSVMKLVVKNGVLGAPQEEIFSFDH